MMTGINKEKSGNDQYDGELLAGTLDNGAVFSAQQSYAFFVVPLPYLVSFNPPEGTPVMKETPSFDNLESLHDLSTCPPSWENFVSELDAQAPTIMPSWDEFVSEFEEMVYKELEKDAKDLVEDAKELGTSLNEEKDLVENMKALENKADDMAAMTMMPHMLSESVNKDIELEANTPTMQPCEESRSSVESEKELEANVKDTEKAAMAMMMLSLSTSATPLSHKGLEDTGLDVSNHWSWWEKEGRSIKDRQQIDTYTKESDEIVQGSNEESNNEESLSVIRQGGLCSGRFGQCANHAVKGGRCLKCSRRYTCSNKECANYPVKGGVCVRHGGSTPTCSHKGCTNNARRKGLCLRHGGKKTCVHEGCTNIARHRGGVCWSHNTTDVILQPCYQLSVEVFGEGVCSIP